MGLQFKWDSCLFLLKDTTQTFPEDGVAKRHRPIASPLLTIVTLRGPQKKDLQQTSNVIDKINCKA